MGGLFYFYIKRNTDQIRAKALGSQDAVAAGGRYDGLVEELGGPSLGAFGFAAGIERILMASAALGCEPAPSRRGLYIAIAQPALVNEGFRLAQDARARGVATLLDYDGRSLKAQLREADKAGVRFVAIVGEQELQQRTVTVKDLEQGGAQDTIALDAFAEQIAARLLKKPSCH